ncbi:MAG: extracellular solute-binding protein [Geminicoccales bacterium]
MTIAEQHLRRWLFLAMALGGSGLAPLAEAEPADITLSVGRFFGPCPDAGTEIAKANGEACIIQAILNAFNAENNGIKIDMRPANWDNYYRQLQASYAEGSPPDVHILHRHRLEEFVDDGLLASIGDGLVEAGIDVGDWEPYAREAVAIKGKTYGIPLDIHANVWHINLDILKKAGLIGRDGRPILPKSPGEMLDHGMRVKEATGKDYLASDFIQFPIGVRAVLSLLWQQNKNVFDGDAIALDTPEMRAAVTTMTDLFAAGYADPQHNYEQAQQAFLENEVAILINGTWAVEFYDRAASNAETSLTNYDVADFPTFFEEPATWGDAHIWAVPASLKERDPEAYGAALKLLAWINEHNKDWARTGHLAIRTSVLESEAYTTLPHRVDYQQSGKRSRDIPQSPSYDAVHETLTRNLQAVWMGKKSLDEALADAEVEIDVHSIFR